MTKKGFFKVLGLLLVVGLLFAALPTGKAEAATTSVVCTGTGDSALLQAAITAAADGDTISVTGTCVLDSNITVSKAVTLDGNNKAAKIQVSGTGDRITMTTAGATLQGFEIEKTDKNGLQNIIWINANNITIANNKIHGQFAIGDGDVTRAIVISGGNSGLTITGNEFFGLRQPAYISGVTTGNITYNYTHGTKGWVLEQGDMTFSGNTWGTVELGNPNVYDIAILSGVNPAYYSDVPAMSAANNNAFIEDQRYSPARLTPVFVDASAPACSDCGTARMPYQTIQAGIARVIAGGTVYVAAGTYNEGITLNKPNITVQSIAGAASTIIDVPDGTLTTGVKILGTDLGVVTFDGFTVKDFTEQGIVQGMGSASGTTVHIFNNVVIPAGTYLRNGIQVSGNGSTVIGNTVSNAPLTADWGGTGIHVVNASNVIVRGNTVSGNGDVAIAVDNYNAAVVENVTIENNIVSGSDVAVGIQGGPDTSGKLVQNLTIVGNDFGASLEGIDVAYVTLAGANIIERNDFSENPTYIAIYKDGYPAWGYPGATVTGTIDASPNWYGSVAGPDVAKFYDDNATDSFEYTDPLDFAYIPWCSVANCSQTAGPVTNVTQHKGFATIQAAIDDATAGDTIHVAAGTYAEALTINKQLTLSGPNAEINPNGGTRVAEATIVYPAGLIADKDLVSVSAAGVSFAGFTLDGRDLDAALWGEGIYSEANDLTVKNNIVKNFRQIGIRAGALYGGPYFTGALIENNQVTSDVSGFYFTYSGIYLQGTQGIVRGNVVDSANRGIQIQPYKNPASTLGVVENNTFAAYKSPLYFNYSENANSNWVFRNNILTGIASPTGTPVDYFAGITVQTFYSGNVLFERNQVNIGSADATAIYQYYELGTVNGTRSATPNWWGSILGPAAGRYSGTAAFDPWCGDAACSFLVSATEPTGSGFYVKDGKLLLKGSINVTGGIVINEPLYILLRDGTVIQNSSPCFVVNSSNVTITTESIGGAKCVPTNGANGIDVASALNNITIEGIEFDGTGQTTGDGIHFAGAIQDFVLVDNYIHDLDGDGIKFAGNVSEVVNIQGNMFKANGGSGINNLGANTVGAEYNSWGNVAGPAAGDGVSGLVTSAPFTHADLYLVSSGTPWANQVVKGQQITYTVMAHLVNVNAADFVLTYPAELTYVSSAVSGSMGTESVLHNATARTLQFIGYNTANLTGDLPLFTVTFTAGTNVVNAPLSFSYGKTSGFGMVGYESSSNVFVNEMVNGTVTVIDLPTISSTDIQGYYLTGEQRQFSVVLDNPSTGGNYAHVYTDFTITNAQVEQISLIEYSVDNGTNWVALGTGPGTSFANSGTDIVGYFGKMPGGGFALAPNTSLTTLFRVTFVTREQGATDFPTSYAVTMQLRDADALPASNLLDDFSGTMYVYDKATVTVASTDQYLIVGEPGAFTVTINNPTTGRDYDNSVVFDILIPSHAVTDFSALSCSITSPAPFTWNLLPSLVPDGAGGVKARIAGLDGYFEVPPTGVNMVLNCSVTVTTAGTYSASGRMVDVVDKVTPLERVVSDSVGLSTVAYAKPVITPTNLGGPFDAGVPETVSLSIANASIPEPFEVVLVYPAGTVIVYNGVTYTCAATCPPIPVDLTAEPTVLNFTVTFDEAWTGDVSVSLYDSDWTPADRLLASASATDVVVSGGFAVTGTFSMQGNASRADIPVTLTWGGTLATYGPSASTTSAISNNFSLSVLYGGEYTITTLQPRYLNVTADLLKKITVAGPYNMSALILKGGNAYWKSSLTILDNVINTSDASLVGGQYGTPGTETGIGNHGDCNFDGIVNIQDLALVGGNWSLTSAAAYNGTLPWVP